jgi:hypothetical protein
MKKAAFCLLVILLLLSSACGKDSGSPEDSRIAHYSDVRVFKDLKDIEKPKPSKSNYSADDIKTFWYNSNTEFPGNEKLAADILENGKNPGLGVRALHEKGITGKGVNIAVIDANLAQPYHSEYYGT